MKRKTSRRLRFAALFVVAALVATVAASAVAVSNTYAVATNPGTVYWGASGSQQDKAASCGDYTMTWVLSAGTNTISNPLMYVDWGGGYGPAISPSKTTPGATQFVTPGGVPVAAKATYEYPVGTADPSPNLVVSHCNIPEEPETGSLEITKSIPTDPTADLTQFSVNVASAAVGYNQNHTFPASGVITIGDLEPGTYTVTENTPLPAGYSYVSGNNSVQVAAGQTASVTITNVKDPELGSLQITKVIDPADPTVDYTQFSVNVACAAVGYNQNHTFPASGVITIGDLEPGTYTVTENTPLPAGYSYVSGNNSVQVAAGQTASVTITNTEEEPEPGSLEITKSVSGDPSPDYTQFSVNVKCAAVGYDQDHQFPASGVLMITGLDAGTYTVTEKTPLPAGYFYVSGNGDVQVTSGGTGQTTINNSKEEPEPGSLEITKNIDTVDPNPDYTQFSVNVKCTAVQYDQDHQFPASGVLVINGLDPGLYTVTEKSPLPAGYFYVSGNGDVQVDSAQTGQLAINNEELGSLQITKAIDPADPTADLTQFSVNVACAAVGYNQDHSFPASGVLTIDDLKPGTYTVTEKTPLPTGYAYVTGNGGVVVEAGGIGEITITNTELGSLRITKAIEGDNPDNLKYKDFEIAVTGPDNYSWYGPFGSNGEIFLDNLKEGSYTVVEKAPGYPFKVEVSPNNGLVEVKYANETGVTIVNTGSTTTSTTVSVTESTTRTTGTTTQTTTFGFTTSDTVFGWVMQPDDIQTGGGGTAGGGNGALLVLVLSSTLLAGVLTASALGVRAGVL